MKIVLVYLFIFYLFIRSEFASKVATKQSGGAHLIKTKSGKYFLSNEKRDSVEKTKKEKTLLAANGRHRYTPPGNFNQRCV